MDSARKPKSKVGDRFLAVPYRILARTDINANEKLLLAHIWSYGSNGCWETNETMGRLFNVTPRQVTTWIGHLKKTGCLLWLHGANYHRTLWARGHPDVSSAAFLQYRGQMILKEALHSGGNGTAPPGRDLPGREEGSFHVTGKARCNLPGRELPQTNNRTEKETNTGTGAALVRQRAPALLEVQRQRARDELEHRISGLFKTV